MLILSSRNAHFKRPDIGNRIIPFHFEGPENGIYINESDLFDELSRDRANILGELLTLAGKVADLIASGAVVPKFNFRMADLASFGWFVSEVQGRGAEWPALLERLKDAQAEFVSEDDSLISWLRERARQRRSGNPRTDLAQGNFRAVQRRGGKRRYSLIEVRPGSWEEAHEPAKDHRAEARCQMVRSPRPCRSADDHSHPAQ